MPTEQSSKPITARKDRLSITAAYYAGFIILGMTTALLGPTLPGLAEHTGARLSEISFLFTARSLGYMLGALVGGRLYDRLAGHNILASVLLLMAGGLALAPVISLLWLLTGVMLVVGFGEGALDVGSNTLLVWLHRSKVDPFLNALHFFFGVGSFLAPILVAQVLLWQGDIQWAYWGVALLIAPLFLWFLRLPNPSESSSSAGKTVSGVDGGLVALFAVFFFLYVGAEVGFGGWVYTYATALNLTDVSGAAYMTSAFWGALTIGRMIAIPVSMRVRPGRLLLIDLLGCLLSLAVIVLQPASATALWAGAIGLGLFMASIFPMTISVAERRMGITGQVTGWFFFGVGLGGMFLPWLIGQLFVPLGPYVTMLALGVDLLAALCFFGLMRFVFRAGDTQPVGIEEIEGGERDGAHA
jgi:FHS family Na+ dependent glucose MFS transporter 1